MSGEATLGTESALQRFSKKVPATSVAPTFKLTLPAEIVTEALCHLIDKDFTLVDESRQHSWIVSILPRKNKDKFEYTLQGWRAFAEEQNVRTGDLLNFFLLEGDYLLVGLIRRGSLAEQQQQAGEGLPSTPDAQAGRDSFATSSEEKQHLRQLGKPGSFHGSCVASGGTCSQSHTRTPVASPRAGTELQPHPTQMLHILELGHDPLDEALSSQLVQRSPVDFLATRIPDLETPTREGSQMGCFGHKFYSSSSPPNPQQWVPQDSARAGVQPGTPKRQKVGSLRGLEQHKSLPLSIMDPRRASGLEMHRSAPASLEDRTQAIQQLGSFQHSPAWDQHVGRHQQRSMQDLMHTGRRFSAADLGALDPAVQSPEIIESKQEVKDLQNALKRVHLRAARAEGEAANLLQVLGNAEHVLEQQTARGLATVNALFNIAGRLASPDILRFVDPTVAQELSLLQSELKHHTDGVLDAFWHMRNLTAPEIPGAQVNTQDRLEQQLQQAQYQQQQILLHQEQSRLRG